MTELSSASASAAPDTAADPDAVHYTLDGRPAVAKKGELLMDISDNLAPGVSWPPEQTTICVLGSSIPSSIASAIRMFRDEILVHIKDGACPFGGAPHG